MLKRVPHGRKILVASIGVAAVSYVACGGGSTVANLIAPPPEDGGTDATDGNTNQKDVAMPNWDVVANLLPPPPHD